MGSCNKRILAEALYMPDPTEYMHQYRMNPVQDSNSNAQANTTQYMSHGVRSAGSDVLRAL